MALYGGRGIKCRITIDEIYFLWKRDEAGRMKKPCIDRIDPDGDYVIWNCQFIEERDNMSRGSSMRPLIKKAGGTTESVRVKKYLLDTARKLAEKEDRSLKSVVERALIKELFPLKKWP